MPPRPGMDASDLVTPGQFAGMVPGISAQQVYDWVRRAPRIIGREVRPLGRLGTYPRYDFNDLAALEREMRRRRQQREAAAQAA
jgi:hypothetical protein